MATIVHSCVAVFDSGRIVSTQRAAEVIHPDDLFRCLVRHISGDWGDLEEFDWKANDDAVEFGSRILSSYKDRNGIRFWITTEADRSATTVRLPEEF